MRKWILAVVLLVTHGMSHAAPSLESYSRLPAVEIMSLSPSGERYAFVGTVEEQRTVGVLTVSGALLFRLATGETKVVALDWAGDDYLLVTTVSTINLGFDFVHDKADMATVHAIRLSDQKVSTIFKDRREVGPPVLGYYGNSEIESKRYGFFAGLEYVRLNGRSGLWPNSKLNLYRVDLDSGQPTAISGSNRHGQSWVLDKSGNVVAHSEYNAKSGLWRIFPGLDRSRSLIEKETPLYDFSLRSLGRGPNTFLIVNSSGDDDLIEEWNVSSRQMELIFKGMTTGRVLTDSQTGYAIGVELWGKPGFHFFDPHHQARYNGAVKAFPERRVHLVSYAKNLEKMIVRTSGSKDSGTFWMVNIATGQADPIGYAYPDIRPATVSPIRTIEYQASDGLNIEGILTLPNGREPVKLPLIVLPHGGPFGIQDHEEFDWWAQAYASLGYAVLQPNFRGSSGYGPAFFKAGIGQWGRKMQTDLSDGVAMLHQKGMVDRNRVCIVGASYGGYAALAGVTLQEDIYRCAVSVNGVSDLPGLIRWQRSVYGRYSPAVRKSLALLATESTSSLRDISPIEHGKRASAPILIIYGENDLVVPESQSKNMVSALRGARKTVEELRLRNEDHNLSKMATRKEMLLKTVQFLRRHNPPD